MAANAPQTSTSSKHLCKLRGLGVPFRRYRPSAHLIQVSRPKRYSRSPPGRSLQPCLQLGLAVTCQDNLLVCRCHIARPGIFLEYGQGCLKSSVPGGSKTFSGQSCKWNASSHRARAQKLTARAFQVDNRELIVGDVLAIVCFCLYKQVKPLLSPSSFPANCCGIVMPSLHCGPIVARYDLSYCRSQLCSSCQISLVGWPHCTSIQVSRFHHP